MVYRPGDRVKIVNPEKFIRCGYPFDQRAETQRIIDTFPKSLEAFIDGIDPENRGKGMGKFGDLEAFAGRIARIVAVRNDFGGNTRSIFTERDEPLIGAVCQVHSKRVVKTGIRVIDSDDDQGFYSYLDAEKTHIILQVYPLWSGLDDAPRLRSYSHFEIETCNVESVQ